MANIVSATLMQINMGGAMVDSNTYQITYDNGAIKYVPIDPNNSDYQQYLAWKALGN